MRKKIRMMFQGLGMVSSPRWLMYSLLVGIASGLGAIMFILAMDECTGFFLHYLANFHPPGPDGEPAFIPVHIEVRRWALIFVPAIGALISGLIVYFFAPEAEGDGADALIKSFHHLRGNIRTRIPYIKALTSAITIGSGGSAGREGPIAQIGGGFGSWLGSLLKLSDKERRILVIAGTGAGLGSIFRAPLGGALFATEFLYHDPEFEFEAIIPTILASITAYCVFCFYFGFGTIFGFPEYPFTSAKELPLFTVLGVICGLVGVLFVKLFHGMKRNVFDWLRGRMKRFLVPAIGGLMVGCIGYFYPETMSLGYGYAQQTLDGNLSLKIMLIICFGKILTTSITLPSGGSGGSFGPSIVIGAALGGAFGYLMQALFPSIVLYPANYAMVGMCGIVTATSKTPIAALVMVAEMTGGYTLLVPTALVSTLSYLFSERVSIYEEQVKGRVDSPAHTGDFMVDILQGLRVQDVMRKKKKVFTVPESARLRDIWEVVQSSTALYFPVVNEQKEMTGIISIDDLRSLFFEGQMADLLIAKDFATKDVISLVPDEDLSSALRKFTMKNLDELPVTKGEGSKKVLGMLSRRDIISKYCEVARTVEDNKDSSEET
jgi:chloride channel protein, CIC family